MWNITLIFPNKNHGLHKNFSKKQIAFLDYVPIVELHIVHTWRHIQSE